MPLTDESALAAKMASSTDSFVTLRSSKVKPLEGRSVRGRESMNRLVQCHIKDNSFWSPLSFAIQIVTSITSVFIPPLRDITHTNQLTVSHTSSASSQHTVWQHRHH